MVLQFYYCTCYFFIIFRGFTIVFCRLMCFEVAKTYFITSKQFNSLLFLTLLLILGEFLVSNYFFCTQNCPCKMLFVKKDSQRSGGQFLSFSQGYGHSFNLLNVDFAVQMVKEWNFLHVVVSSFDERVKKQSTDNIKVKCSQLGQVCLIFLNMSAIKNILVKQLDYFKNS